MAGETELMMLAGGPVDDMPQQTVILQPEVTIVQPPPDNTLLWVSGVVVPLVIAIVGWWLVHRRKSPERQAPVREWPKPPADDPYAKSPDEK